MTRIETGCTYMGCPIIVEVPDSVAHRVPVIKNTFENHFKRKDLELEREIFEARYPRREPSGIKTLFIALALGLTLMATFIAFLKWVFP